MAALFVFWGQILSISEEILIDELLHTGKLNGKRRGELAELAFMRKAAALGFALAKPWGESDRYDVVVRAGNVFSRVQIKSVWSVYRSRSHYRVKTSSKFNAPYTANEIDFLVAYIFPKDTWYVFPVALVENRKVLCLSPECKRSKFEPYREAWKLMRPAYTENAVVGATAEADSKSAAAT
jgi:hypothetical protein